jgi:hypothetical protein
MENLSQKLAEHPHFWAMPGMLIDSPEDGMVRCLERNDHQGPPVLSDWATQGCLLELLLESRNITNADVHYDGTTWTVRCNVRDKPLEVSNETLGQALVPAILVAWEERYYDQVSREHAEGARH